MFLCLLKLCVCIGVCTYACRYTRRSNLKFLFLCIWCFACMNVCVAYVFTVPEEAKEVLHFLLC